MIGEWNMFEATNLVPEMAIQEPTDTVVFGEKDNSCPDFHVDYFQGQDMNIVAQSRHNRGANFAFADGSARYLKFGKSIDPVNLWAILPENRKLGGQ
jgi:prepilin-type processing-associated H-X9-DG protein